MASRPALLSRSPYLLAALGAFIIMGFAFVNGYALFFNDSRSYVRGPAQAIKALFKVDLTAEWPARSDVAGVSGTERDATGAAATPGARGEHGYVANRSIYYGALPFVGYLTGDFWLAIFLQAYAVALALAILMRPGLELGVGTYALVLVALSGFTSLGPIAALMMPDVFAAVMIVAFTGLAAFWGKLRPDEKGALFGLIVFAACAHASHLAILAVLIAGTAAMSALDMRFRGRWTAMGLACVALAVGVAGNAAFDAGLRRVTGERPLLLPHLTAHLVDLGPGTDFARHGCAPGQFKVCEFADRLPQYWEDFLGADPRNGVFASADVETKRALSDEQVRFALATFRFDPWGVTLGLAGDGLRQIGRFSLRDLEVTLKTMDNYRSVWPPRIAERIGRSLAGRAPSFMQELSAANYAVCTVSLLALAGLFVAARRRPGGSERWTDFWVSAQILLGGVVINALVCGVLASPYDRFQARVIWLVPLTALLGLAVYRRASASLRDASTAYATTRSGRTSH